MTCVCCEAENPPRITKCSISFAKCRNCGSIYTTQDISKVIETDNDQEIERNKLPINLERLKRAEEALGRKIEVAFDFGCGNGFLVNLLSAHGIRSEGINYETRALIDWLPRETYDAIFMIEVIEHLTNPREVFERLLESLKSGGVIMIETTFADQINDSKLSSYVDPKIGHVNVVSRSGLMKLLPTGLKVSRWVNSNVCVLRKD